MYKWEMSGNQKRATRSVGKGTRARQVGRNRREDSGLMLTTSEM